jgi:hypothetical protein
MSKNNKRANPDNNSNKENKQLNFNKIKGKVESLNKKSMFDYLAILG